MSYHEENKIQQRKENDKKNILQIRKNLLMFLQVLNDLGMKQENTIFDDDTIVSRTDKLLHYTSQIELYKLQSTLYYLIEIITKLDVSLYEDYYKIQLHKN